LTRSVPRLGGRGIVSSLSFAVTNQDLFSNLFASGGSPNPENEEVNVYLYFDDGTAILDTEREKLFTGIIGDFPEINYNKVAFRVDSKDILSGQKIGTLITESNFPDAPPESFGKTIPILYGNHTFENIKTLTPAAATLNSVNNMVEGVPVSGTKYLIANSEINELNTDDIWLLDSQTGRLLLLDSSHVTVSNPDSDGYTSIELAISGEMIAYDWWFPDSADDNGVNYLWSNINNVVDRDIDTFASLTVDFGFDGNGELRLSFPDYDMKDFSYISEIEVFYRGKYNLISGTDTNVLYRILDNTAGIVSLNLKAITAATNINDVGSYTIEQTEHKLLLQNGDGGDNEPINFHPSGRNPVRNCYGICR